MHKRSWHSLRKLDASNYELQAENNSRSSCTTRTNFAQLAFDWEEEWIIAVDSRGDLFYIELSDTDPCYQKLGRVGQATFLAFNPIDKCEIIVGLANADIKLCRIAVDASKFCLLTAHKIPPVHISFYKDNFLTASREEVVIWSLKTCSKVQQLRIGPKNAAIKKASFSSLGHIVALYQNDMIQAWTLKHLDKDSKIDTKAMGIRNIRDFTFTKNGRAMIMAGAQNKIIVLNTCNWTVIKNFCLSESSTGLKYLSVVPLPLDGGANKIVATVSLDCNLQFLDLDSASLFESPKYDAGIKKIAVSQNGRYLAYISQGGSLVLTFIANRFVDKCREPQVAKETIRPPAHAASDHLKYIKENIRQELCLERVLPILKEFGEYPEKHRTTIWSTLLNLPGKRCAYSTIANKAACTKFTYDFLKEHPLASRSKRILLTTTLNCLVQWSPLLSQCTFLPNFVFPFITVFEKDLMHGFELILTILINYCQKWFEYNPLPPLNVLGIVENILLEADPPLLNLFCELGITSSEYAWPLLKTTLSEVLSDTEWLILWDHLISYQKPSLLLLVVVAYSIFSRDIIMSTVDSLESCKEFYTTQSHVTARYLLKIAKQLDRDLSSRTHPTHYLSDELTILSSDGPYPPFTLCTDYPNFLTENSSVIEITRLKEKERALNERKRRDMEKTEITRLHHEMQTFMNQIHQKRLNEVQKCMQQRIHSMNWPAQSTFQTVETQGFENETDRTCDELQRGVDRLEYEVQQLLNTFKSTKTGH